MLSKVLMGFIAVAAAVPVFRDFEWHGSMSEGQTLEIKGINGSIVAVAASGSEAGVTAEKHGKRDDPEDVEIVVIEHDDGITICAVYPPPEGDRPNSCAPGNAGRMNNGNNDVTVDFRVEVPTGVRYMPRTVNGDIRATDLRSDVRATTVNGEVELSTSGSAEARTVNGSIEATMGEADRESRASFSTVNGDISLNLPATVNADVHARTVNGEITTDYPLTVQGRFGPRSIDGTLGEGGPDLDLETVNGEIALRRSN